MEKEHQKQLQRAADMTRDYEREQEKHIEDMEAKYGPQWYLRDDVEELK